MMGWLIRCKSWLGHYFFPIPKPPPTRSPDLGMSSEEEAALRREILTRRNEWRGGESGEEIGRRLYGETRTFELDQIYRGAEGNIGRDEDSRQFNIDRIHKS